MVLDEDSTDVSSSSPNESSKEISECPFMGGSVTPANGICPGLQGRLSGVQPHSFTLMGITIKSKDPLSPRMKSLVEGLNEPGDSGNPPEPPPWFDRQLFDRGREFYERYLFCMSFADLLSLVLMLSAERALQPLIYTGQSDTPQKALKRYFSTLLHIATWYRGDVWDPEDDAHKDILAIRSVHHKVARRCNSVEENEKVSNIQVSDRGHKEPECPLYTSFQQDLDPQVEAKHIFINPENPHYLSQFDMSMTQYSFMGLVVAHPEKMGAGAATKEEFAGLIHFWRGIGWLLGIKDKYNFCSGNVAETKALCLEVERLLALPSLAEADWNYEHMATCVISGIQVIAPNLSFPTMFRYLAHTTGMSVTSFTKRMSIHDCFQYWIMRLGFALMVVFPSIVTVLSSGFSSMISKALKNKSGRKVKCSKTTISLAKNYSPVID